MGPDNVVWGSDSVWYGSPQWQIDALWRFQIPEQMRRRYGYPELTPQIKRKILGLNSARLYGIKVGSDLGTQFRPVPRDYPSKMTPDFKHLMEVDKPVADNLDRMRELYAQAGGTPDHVRYGWIRTS